MQHLQKIGVGGSLRAVSLRLLATKTISGIHPDRVRSKFHKRRYADQHRARVSIRSGRNTERPSETASYARPDA